MFRLDASPTAALVLDTIPGLRQRVESTLQGVFETALEIRRMHGSAFDTDDRFMRIRVSDYLVSYLLDLDTSMVRVMLIEPIGSVEQPMSGVEGRARGRSA